MVLVPALAAGGPPRRLPLLLSLLLLALTTTPVRAFTASSTAGRRLLQLRPARPPAVTRMSATTDERIVVVGGGIIGASILYQLTLKGFKPTLVERCEVAAAASGKSGGFLARTWTDSGPTKQLHRLSYEMHAQLARDLGLESYRKVTTLGVQGGVKKKQGGGGGQQHPSWLDGNARSELMDDDTAQVTPKELTTKMVAAAVAKGAEVVIGTVEGMAFAEDEEEGALRTVTGVRIEGRAGPLPCDKVVVATGPWAPVAGEWFGCPFPMEGIYSTSIVLEGGEAVQAEPYALFCAEDRNGCHLEVYPRPDGSVYICGLGGSDYVSGSRLAPGGDCDRPEKIVPNPKRVAAAMRSFGDMSPSLTDGKEPVTNCCMRPCPPDALPIMGRVPTAANAYVAAGHNCWGILGAPATGLVMAELVGEGKASSVDLAPFDPSRFMRASARRGKKIRGVEVGEQW